MKSPANTPGPKRSPKQAPPPAPPIDERLVYPWRRLRDWGIGGRTLKELTKAGFRGFKFGKMKFFRGAELIGILESGGGQPHLESGAPAEFYNGKPQRNGKALPELLPVGTENGVEEI